jgi:hypothetical protein
MGNQPGKSSLRKLLSARKQHECSCYVLIERQLMCYATGTEQQQTPDHRSPVTSVDVTAVTELLQLL